MPRPALRQGFPAPKSVLSKRPRPQVSKGVGEKIEHSCGCEGFLGFTTFKDSSFARASAKPCADAGGVEEAYALSEECSDDPSECITHSADGHAGCAACIDTKRRVGFSHDGARAF